MRIKSVAGRMRASNLEHARAVKSVKGVKIKRPPLSPYKEHSIDPDLRKRRLVTLIQLLTLFEKGHVFSKKGGLTRQEAREWANQCRNLL